VHYYLGFGWRNLIANLTERALDRFDDLWTGLILGQTALGFYSRAYAVATYPRRMIMDPTRNVFSGAYAELKGDRGELSRAVFRSNAALIRLSFLAGGVLFVTAQEFISLVLTEKWLPMLDAFRILLFYAVLDPSRRALADLFIAVGKPHELIRSRTLQLLALAGSLFVLGPVMDIVGVAISVNLALLLGLSVMIRRAREYIDFSLMRLLGIPTVGLSTGIGLILLLTSRSWFTLESWQTGLVKAAAFSIFYCGLLGGLEYRKLLSMARYFTQYGRLQRREQSRNRSGKV
jgi:PST family polysaccharide transporter